MRAGSSLLLLLLRPVLSCAFEVQPNHGGETKLHDFLPHYSTADQFTDQSSANIDIWAEVRMLRDMVLELRVEQRNLETRLKETELQTDEQRLDLLLTKTSLEELKRDHTAMDGRLRASEKQVEDLTKENMAQAAELTSLKTKLETSERQVEELKVNLENQASELLSTQAEVAVGENELQLLKRQTDDMHDQNTVQDVKLSSLMDKTSTTEHQVDILIKESAKVAFYAALTDSGDVGPYNTPAVLRFTKVFSNIGDAYSPTTGFFTAPVKGLYLFRFTVCGAKTNNALIGVKLFLNGKSIIYNLQTTGDDSGDFEYLSNAVILELNVNDELHLVLPEEGKIFDNTNNHSTFSGFLLFTI